MICSMTGFGRSSLNEDGRELTVELKAVNHRFLDLSLRMPRSLNFLEDIIRSTLSKRISRGHIDVSVTYRNSRSDAVKLEINKALLTAYLNCSREAAEEFDLTDDITVSNALRFPDVLIVTEADEDKDALAALMTHTLDNAISELIEMRAVEGERLKADLIPRIDKVMQIRDEIANLAPAVVEDYRNKLNERIESILSETEVDRARLATEIALFADRANIDEELVRIASHVKSAKELLSGDGPTGRKLDFIVQEMNREFNTIGSKANSNEISALVIEGKAEIEKIREQVQNFE